MTALIPRGASSPQNKAQPARQVSFRRRVSKEEARHPVPASADARSCSATRAIWSARARAARAAVPSLQNWGPFCPSCQEEAMMAPPRRGGFSFCNRQRVGADSESADAAFFSAAPTADGSMLVRQAGTPASLRSRASLPRSQFKN